MRGNNNRISTLASSLLFFVCLFAFGISALAQHTEHEGAEHHENAPAKEELNLSKEAIDHVVDSHVWHFSHSFTIYLPVLVYSSEKGFETFSSANFYDEHHHVKEYNGYVLDETNKIHLASGGSVFDFSITKNVAMLLINATLLLLVFLAVAKGYQRNKGKAPKGVQSFLEPVLLFIRDEVVKPNIGPRYEKFLPYMFTLFFFILFGNLLGLLPGAANLTGNIGVTFTLAILTFIITNVSGNKDYWVHILWTPGVPILLRPIILLVEVIGVFTKPISLMVRLFVAITAGHIVLICLISLTFIFGSIWVGFGSTILVLFVNLIEIMVAGIQAYVFTLFTSLYIGMAIVEHEHHDHH